MTGNPLRRSASPLSHVARTTLLLAVLFGLDKALGLFRQIVIGRQFGVGSELDAFNAANNLPDMLFALISGGALSIALIPVLSQALEREGREALWALFARIANIAFLLTALFALMITAFAGQLVQSQVGIAPGFNPQMQSLVAALMRLNLLATLIFSLSGLVSAGLQANQHFLLPALAPVLYDLGQIFGALVLAPDQGYRIAGIQLPAAGLGVHGLVYGVILGAAFHLLIQVPGLVRYRFRWAPRLGLDHPGVRKVARLMGPRILTIGAFQLTFVVQDNLASRLNEGSVTALAYGWQIMQVPETLIGTALGIAVLPTLSEHFARGDDPAFEASLARWVRTLLALTVPAALLLMVAVRPLVQAAFQFQPSGTELVVAAARAYLLGLVAHSLIEVTARAFYARQDARTPLLATVINAVLFIGLSLLLFRPLQSAGIALSNSIAFSVEAIVLVLLLGRLFPGATRHGRLIARLGLGTALGAGVCFLVMAGMPHAPFLSAILGLGIGSLLLLPFIWPELRGLARL